MRKGQPVCDLEEVLKSGLDPRKMPTNPENTPPSPPQSRGDRSVLGEELKRTQNPPRPVVLINITRQRPEEPDSTHPEVTSQTKEEAKASKDKWIRKAKGQRNAPVITQTTTPGDSANQTGCAHFSGQATPFCPQISSCRSSAARGNETNKTSRQRITGPVYTIKDRLGPFPKPVDFSNKSGTGEQVPEKVPEKEPDPEEEPEEVTEEELEPEDMAPLDLLREVLRWRSLKKQKKPREPGDDPEGRQ
jgi:hypothetical protein